MVSVVPLVESEAVPEVDPIGLRVPELLELKQPVPALRMNAEQRPVEMNRLSKMYRCEGDKVFMFNDPPGSVAESYGKSFYFLSIQ